MRLVVAVFTLALSAYTAASQEFAGPADVVDAQTLVIGTTVVELYGVIAPKLEQLCFAETETWSCGVSAADALSAWVSNTEVVCRADMAATTEPKYRCFTEGNDLGKQLIQGGWALASLTAGPDYHEQEAHARRARLGIFRAGFEPNNAWRLWASTQPDGVGCSACTLRKQSLKKRVSAEVE